MSAIPIFRSAHLLPYLTFLRELGAPVEKELRRAKLPAEIPDKPDGYLPKLPVLVFLDNISQREGIDECGLRTAHYQKTNRLTQLLFSHIAGAPTLKSALELFARFVRIEDVSVKLWLAYETNHVRVCIHDSTPDVTATNLRIADWTQLTLFLKIIQMFTGNNWYPKRMGFAANASLHNYAYAQFPNTELHINQQYSWIEMPYHLLTLSSASHAQPSTTKIAAISETSLDINLPTALMHLINSYLHDDTLSINTLAEISGMSLRSLQRRLSETGTSYSELLEQVRIEKSMEMLENFESKIIDVAYSMGYSDPSHFSRAFRRVTGFSPRIYRQQLAVRMT